MQNKGQSLLLTHRENYVPEGQEHKVHCKIAKLDESGSFIERPRLVHYGVKKFETIFKENLETMGYTIEILHHPLGRYSNVVIRDKDAEIAQKDDEIARLKAELAKRETTEVVEETAEPKAEEEKKKAGRPKKEA